MPQPSQEPDSGTRTAPANVNLEMVPHVVAVKNLYFDHDRKYGPTFEDSDGNVTKITIQLGEDAHLNCRISLLQDKTVSCRHNILFIILYFISINKTVIIQWQTVMLQLCIQIDFQLAIIDYYLFPRFGNKITGTYKYVLTKVILRC